MIVAILGRIPALGIAECERVFGSDSVAQFSEGAATVATDAFDVERFGSIVKAGRVVAEFPARDWRDVSKKIVQAYGEAWANHEHKITLGISAYGFDRLSPKDVQKTGLVLKSKLKSSLGSLRLVPNDDVALSSATSHHNKLGLSDNKVELLIVHDKKSGKTLVAESVGAQNITALARRDQGRPKRDAFVGMLPPKLALTMVNLAASSALASFDFVQQNLHVASLSAGPAARSAPSSRKLDVGAAPPRVTRSPRTEGSSRPLATSFPETSAAPSDTDAYSINDGREAVEGNDGSEVSGGAKFRILDPFCGTGVILQEAALLDYRVYGSDLSEKMVDYSQQNIEWLADSHRLDIDATVEHGDAMTHRWQSPIDAVACESYLGQPFSAPPSPAKLREVRGNCNHIISEFLKNIHSQLKPGTPLCVAVPAWRDVRGNFTHLPLINQLDTLGYERIEFKNITSDQLLYYREDQVVARELLVLQAIS